MLIWSPKLQSLRFIHGQTPDRPAVPVSAEWSMQRAAEFLRLHAGHSQFGGAMDHVLSARHAVVTNWNFEQRINGVARLIASGEERILRAQDPVGQIFFDPQRPMTRSPFTAVQCADRGGLLALLNEPKPLAATLAALQAAFADARAAPWLNAAAPVMPGTAKPLAAAILDQAAEFIFRRVLLLLPLNPGDTGLRLAWMLPVGAGQAKPAAEAVEDAPARTQRSTPAPAPAPTLPPPSDPSPQAAALIAAAEDGVPFCAECAAAKAKELEDA